MTISAPSWPRRTDRLLLRQFREDDFQRLLELRRTPDVYHWLLSTEVDPDDYRASWLSTLTDPHDHSTVVELDGAVIGTASLEVRDGMGQGRSEETVAAEADIGYVLDPAHAGRGYATEVATELLRICFEDLGLRRVTAGCFADNHASRRVLEKAGLQLEQYGVRDSWHAELGWVDGCTYAILAEEWLRASSERVAGAVRSR